MDGIKVSDVVLSLAGHDRGRAYVVLGTAGDKLLLSDGKVRKLQNPKQKSAKHLKLAAPGDAGIRSRIIDGTATDRELRIILAVYRMQADDWRENKAWQKTM